jgi:hypothetical protein
VLNGAAAVASTGDGDVLRIVPATISQSGSFFSQTQLNASDFSTSFAFRLTDAGGIHDGTDTGADGFVFVVQPVSSSLGGGGGGLGYDGISPSVGVEFDTWNNFPLDPDSNHLGIDSNGSVTSLQTLSVAPRFDDGNKWYAWIDYNGTTLEVRANQTGVRPALPLMSGNIDIATILGTSLAYVGFTAGTGAAYENHDILSWTYADRFIPEPATGGLLLLGVMLGWPAAGRRAAQSRNRRATLRA